MVALVMTAALGLSAVMPTMQAHAETVVPIGVTAEGTVDATTDITAISGVGQGLVCSTNPSYRVGYKGILDMTNVWIAWNQLKTTYGLQKGIDVFNALTLVGDWEMRFTVDLNTVAMNPSAYTLEAVTAQYVASNPGTTFTQYMRPYAVSMDTATGEFVTKYRLETNGVVGVTAANLDSTVAQTPQIVFPTPEGSITVPTSSFAGVTPGSPKAFDMINPTVRGQLSIVGLNHPALPISFGQIGGPVTLYLADDGYNTSYSYQAVSGQPLPTEISSTVPLAANYATADEMNAVPSSPAVGAEVVAGDQTWRFAGWTKKEVECGNVEWIGSWELIPATPSPSMSPVPSPSATPTPDRVSSSTPIAAGPVEQHFAVRPGLPKAGN